MLEESDDVSGNSFRSLVGRGIWLGLIGVVRFNDGNDLLGIDWDVWSSDAVLGCHNQIWLSSWRLVAHSDVVQTFKRRTSGIDLNDDFVCHLNQFWRSPNRSSGYNSTFFRDS